VQQFNFTLPLRSVNTAIHHRVAMPPRRIPEPRQAPRAALPEASTAENNPSTEPARPDQVTQVDTPQDFGPLQDTEHRIQFALAPALANNDIIDYTAPAGAKLFKAGTDPLPSTFDCTAVNLQLFLDQLKDKASIYAWTSILEVDSKNLIDHYGELTYDSVRYHAERYVLSSTRMAQDSFMMYNCIMNSLSDAAQKQVRNRAMVTPFSIGGRGSGALLLKVVIMVSHVDTRATVTAVRTKLSSLDKAMRDHDSKVEDFNNHVLTLVAQLHARGEQTHDLLVNLFKGYKACKDSEFVEYIKKKEDMYEEGGNIDYNQLMDWAVNKYKARKEAGTWCQRTTEEETIIALQAQVKDLMKASIQSNKSDSQKSGTGTKVGQRGKKTNKKAKKQVNGKTYHWCPNHKAWTRHTAAECKGIPNSNQAKGTEKEKGSEAKLKLSKALAAISDDEEDE
jgi:hypothetical protein